MFKCCNRYFITGTFLACGLLLSSCSGGSWFGDNDSKEPKLEGDRITIISRNSNIEVSESLADKPVFVPESEAILSWEQTGGNPQNYINNIAMSGDDSKSKSNIKIGEGNGWESPFIPAPVTSEKAVFAIDAHNVVTAHSINNIDNKLWLSKAVIDKDGDLSGGGLAYHNGNLVVVTSRGKIALLKADDGSVVWKKDIHLPIRSAPRVDNDIILINTADSKFFALNLEKGNILWTHQGIMENASLMSRVVPAISGNIVVNAYPSGDIFAIHRVSGNVLWADSLLMSQHDNALGSFSGIGGNPLIAGGLVFTVSHNGLLAANVLNNGVRVWQHKISSDNTPWLSGTFLYVLTSNQKLVSIYAPDGRIKWVSDLKPLLDNSGKESDVGTNLKGPYMINGQLLVVDFRGKWFHFNPENGVLTSKTKPLSKGAISPLSFTNNAIYVVDQDAKLHEIR